MQSLGAVQSFMQLSRCALPMKLQSRYNRLVQVCLYFFYSPTQSSHVTLCAVLNSSAIFVTSTFTCKTMTKSQKRGRVAWMVPLLFHFLSTVFCIIAQFHSDFKQTRFVRRRLYKCLNAMERREVENRIGNMQNKFKIEFNKVGNQFLIVSTDIIV